MMAHIALEALDYVVTMTDANKEYSLELPANTKALEFRVRDGTAMIHSFTEGAVDTVSPPGPYHTLKANTEYKKDNLLLSKAILRVACASAGKIVEVRAWK
jgi:hypothetical protein